MRQKIDLRRYLLAAPEVMKFLSFGKFCSEVTQPLLIGCSRLWIKNFSAITEPFHMVKWQARISHSSCITKPIAYISSTSDEGNNMDLVVRLLQEMRNIVQPTDVFEAAGFTGKAHRPVLAFVTEDVGE